VNRLQGRVAIITGGARGMGAATARTFVLEGANVIITDVLENEGLALAQDLGPHAVFFKHDVTDEVSWERLSAFALQKFEKIDILVNNAGIQLFKSLIETSLLDFNRVINVNLVGTFLGMRHIAPVMTEQKRGSIINVSSIDGMKGSNGIAAYATSKWAVRGLTKVAAMEFGHQGVRVNSIHPGWINTAMGVAPGTSPAETQQAAEAIPLQRIGQPTEVAAISLFLASDESSYMCGAELIIDGGMFTGQYYAALSGSPKVQSVDTI
jgi:3alpha(or 20beta)-hydroxysteroid dehydrogenase